MRTITASIMLLSSLAASAAPPDPVERWRHEGEAALVTPLVLQLTDDDGDGRVSCADRPDVVVTEMGPGAWSARLVALDGPTGRVLWSVGDPGVSPISIAGGDLDGDGLVEIVAVLAGPMEPEDTLAVFTHDGRLLRTVRAAVALPDQSPLGLADLDADGTVEAHLGATVVRLSDGATWVGAGDHGAFGPPWSISHAVDALPGPGTELSAGSTLYDAAGNIAWLGDGPEGVTAVGDFDRDGWPEIVVASAGTSAIHVLDGRDGSARSARYPVAPSHAYPPPLVADLDGDGAPELVVSDNASLHALRWTPAGFALAWRQPIGDNCCGSPTAFDFDGDGVMEVLHRDEAGWMLRDGLTGDVLHAETFPSVTMWEMPVVTDLDGNGRPDIVVTGGGPAGTGWAGSVRAYEVAADRPARRIWNQHGSHVDNVTDDGRIPREPARGWTTHGTWHAQEARDNSAPAARIPAAIAVPCSDAPACASGRLARLDGTASSDPDGDALVASWVVACPGGTFELRGLEPTACLPLSCDATCSVTLTVTDACGRSSRADATLTLLDDEAPVIAAAPGALPVEPWPPNHRAWRVDATAFAPVVVDSCGSTTTWRLAQCSSDQPDDARDPRDPGTNGDGHTSGDCVVAEDGLSLLVRAERAGSRRGGREYVVRAIATDACGNASAPAEIGRVRVPHDAGSRR